MAASDPWHQAREDDDDETKEELEEKHRRRGRSEKTAEEKDDKREDNRETGGKRRKRGEQTAVDGGSGELSCAQCRSMQMICPLHQSGQSDAASSEAQVDKAAAAGDGENVATMITKRTMCRHFERNACKYGSVCAFAHSREELGTRVVDPKHHRVKICKYWEQHRCERKHGQCPDAHGPEEIGSKYRHDVEEQWKGGFKGGKKASKSKGKGEGEREESPVRLKERDRSHRGSPGDSQPAKAARDDQRRSARMLPRRRAEVGASDQRRRGRSHDRERRHERPPQRRRRSASRSSPQQARFRV